MAKKKQNKAAKVQAEKEALLAAEWTTLDISRGMVPVWHLHESPARLARLCGGFRRVALGSSGEWSDPGSPDWWDRMAEIMPRIVDAHGRPMTKLHGLRMLDPDIFTRIPLASADSTNAAFNAGMESRWGRYTPPSTWQRAEVIACRIEAHNSAPVWVRRDRPRSAGGLFPLEMAS